MADLLCRAAPDNLQQGPIDAAEDPSHARGVGLEITSHGLVQSKPRSGGCMRVDKRELYSGGSKSAI